MESLSLPHEAKPPPSFPNGALKKYQLQQQQQQPPAAGAEANVGYRECLKNHAAALGGHAVDGCGEFMPSATSDPGVPASLTCAACGCHRNFHRRALRLRRHGHEPSAVVPAGGATTGHDDADDDDSADEEDDEGELHSLHHRRPRSRSPLPYYSAPDMLLALSGGGGGPAPLAQVSPATATPQGGEQLHRRRARTKFSAEQKLRMHELSEKLGWRMPKRDDGTVEEFCRRIGVEKGVFKVWMHNNKQSTAGSSGGMHSTRRPADDVGGHEDEDNGVGFPEKNGHEGKFALHGSSPSSP